VICLVAVLFLTILSFRVGISNGEEENSNSVVMEENIKENVEDINNLVFENNIGGLLIENYNESNNIKLDVKKELTVSDTNINPEEALNNFVVEIYKEEATIFIKTYIQDKENLIEVNDWLEENDVNIVSLSISYKIYVPENIKNFKVKNSLGGIEINDLVGIFDIVGQVGPVDLNNITPLDNSYIQANTGKIDCDINTVKDCNELRLKANLGNINITGLNGENYNLIIYEFMKDVREVFNSEEYCTIIAKSGTGKVIVED
jgi:hypothetical protein